MAGLMRREKRKACSQTTRIKKRGPGINPTPLETVNQAGLVFLGRKHLATVIGARLEVDMVVAAQVTGAAVFDIRSRFQAVVRPAHAAFGLGDLTLRDGHGAFSRILIRRGG